MTGKRQTADTETVLEFYTAKAETAGIVLEADDLAIVADLQASTDDIAALDRALRTDGRTITTQSGTIKVHPALAAVRQLRVTRARLASVIDARILSATAGTAGTVGGQTGVRGVYTGNGSPNQARDAKTNARRGVGRTARPRAGRGA
ncbi:hypothetical protein BJD99_10520 [Rhodococcus sp. 1163]|uniref:hypothetical protein n=1 Tax=Rhodococcus sp. 1163 TaxID=1905289 RepID=UPI000A052685|nr:hypothetical protein [Rhodococcus sp. 1163]ORI16918.1 hypothetical protein BJD99_10520 [Rhodococcus sp. 1163]